MYKYYLNDNNEIYGEVITALATEIGYINGFWISEERLSYMNPDGSFKYKIVDEKLVNNEFDIVSYEQPLLIEKIKSMCRKVIEDYDWKMIRHNEQKDLIALGVDVTPSLSQEEYVEILKAKQNLRDLSNIGEKMVNNISSREELTEAYPLFDYNFSDKNVVKALLKEWSKNV